MIEKIGTFRNQLGTILFHRGDDDLDGLLAELLGGAFQALRKQCRGPGFGLAGPAALLDDPLQLLQ